MARPTLEKHIKFKRLILLLGIPKAHVRGHLETLWDVGYESGDPYLGDADGVEAAAEWNGERGALFNALLNCGGPGRTGFIEEVEGCEGEYQIRDLLDHAPDYVLKRKKREEERKSKHINARDRRSADNGGQRRTTADNGRRSADNGRRSADNGSTPSPSPSPSPSPAPTRAQETSASADVCTETPKSASSVPPEIVLTFPTDGKPRQWSLTQAKLDEYRESFPSLDVVAECRKARQWILDSAARRKTAKGMPKFLGGWLGRAQDNRQRGSPQFAASGVRSGVDIDAIDLGDDP